MALPKLREFTEADVIPWAGAIVQVIGRQQQTIESGQITIVAAATETTVRDPAVEAGGEVFLQPRDASSAALTGLFVSAVNDGSFVMTHAAAVGGEVFAYGILGPTGSGVLEQPEEVVEVEDP